MTSAFIYILIPLNSEKNVLETDKRLVIVKIPAVESIAVTIVLVEAL